MCNWRIDELCIYQSFKYVHVFFEVYSITDTSLRPFPSTPVHENKFATTEYNTLDHGKSMTKLRKR